VLERVLIFIFFQWLHEENNDRYGFSVVMALLLFGCLCVFSRFDVLKYYIFRKEMYIIMHYVGTAKAAGGGRVGGL